MKSQYIRVTATIRLLLSPLMIAISGGLRLYVAFLLVGKTPILALCIAFLLIVYSVYTLDRAMKSKEDEINRQEEENAIRSIVLFIVGISLGIAILILKKHAICPLIAFFPLTIGFIYSKGIKIGKISIRLKGGLGVKNIVVAFTWGFTICAIIHYWVRAYLQLFLIFAFFFLKSFINSVICDYRDIKGDYLAGLKTLPICFGEAKLRKILGCIHFIFHIVVLALILMKLVRFEVIILIYSWFAGMIYIPIYARSKKTIFRSGVVHGEWAQMLMFRSLVLQLSQTVFHNI